MNFIKIIGRSTLNRIIMQRIIKLSLIPLCNNSVSRNNIYINIEIDAYKNFKRECKLNCVKLQ